MQDRITAHKAQASINSFPLHPRLISKGEACHRRGREVDPGWFYPRMNSQGGYAVPISPLEQYNNGYFTKDTTGDLKWNNLADWTSYASLHKGRDVTNRLCVFMDGEKMRV